MTPKQRRGKATLDWEDACPKMRDSIPPTQILDIYNYVITSLAAHIPSLIPWVTASPALLRLATYLRRYKTSSPGTLCSYIDHIKRFCDWVRLQPDDLISKALSPEGIPDPRGLKELKGLLEEYVGELRARGLAPSTIHVAVSALKSLMRVNEVKPPSILTPTIRVAYEGRAPRPEELQRMIQVADLRGRVIVSMLALGGFRIGTLCRLRYYHVKHDLKMGITPLHIHVESDITKGKYSSYDTFIGPEAIEYLNLYLEQRRRGSPSGKIPPEDLDDDSPLIRADRLKEPKPIGVKHMSKLIRGLYLKAGLASERRGRLHVLRPHSIRKFFRTQLAALGVPPDYIEYMMGHRVPTYHDIRMKGVEFLRNIYAAAGLSIRPRTHLSRIEMLKEIIRAWGLDPERILVKEALTEPHRTVIATAMREEQEIKALSRALREMLRREFLDAVKRDPGEL